MTLLSDMHLESHVDVLVVGAGPAGLMCANALAMAGVDVKIIDKRSTKVTVGHADGLQPRSLEVLQSYGLAERLIREGNQMHQLVFYNPSVDGGIECTGRVFNVSAPTARYSFQVSLHQGAIETIFLDSMKDYGVEIERSRKPSAIKISNDADELLSISSYPVKVTLEHLDASGERSRSELVHAKFLIGADGAHSWVRKTLGIKMNGDITDSVWGVIDMIPETNFPDIRNLATIHSTSGACLLIPRERELVRLYTQLSDTDLIDPLTGKVDVSRISPETILSVLKKILYPFELADPKEVEWWTVYTIGQRIASSYSVKDRVFIVGDACHTHSAKGGQGMNAGINDSHNLAWKLVQVLKGWSNPSLLKTYEHERRKFAQDLIEFDKILASRMSAKPDSTKNDDDPQFFQTIQEFISGVGIHYLPSTIVDPKHQRCANNLVIGKRMLPQVFIRVADARPMEIQDMLRADARFKVLFFVGNLSHARITELNTLAEELSKHSSFFCRYSPGGYSSTVFDIVTITVDKKGDINHLTVPAFYRPHWTRVLLDDTDATRSQGGHGYERYGIDPKQITLVVVRPDGYVGVIAPSTSITDLENYFGSFMVPQ